MASFELDELLSAIWTALSGIICLLLCLFSVHQLYVQDSSSWISKSYRNLTMLAMLLFTISSFTDCMHIIRYITNFPVLTESQDDALSAAFDVTYFTGNIIFYTLLLLRIYSVFEMSTKTWFFLAMLIIISSVLSAAYCFFILFQQRLFRSIHLVVWPLCINDFILNLALFLIFVLEMKRTVNRLDVSMSEEVASNVHSISSLITKHCVLFGSAIITNQAFFATVLFWSIQKAMRDVTYGYVLPYSARALENISNVLSLWLILRVNYDRYLCLCRCCHLCVANCCMKDAEYDDKISNPYLELQTME